MEPSRWGGRVPKNIAKEIWNAAVRAGDFEDPVEEEGLGMTRKAYSGLKRALKANPVRAGHPVVSLLVLRRRSLGKTLTPDAGSSSKAPQRARSSCLMCL